MKKFSDTEQLAFMLATWQRRPKNREEILKLWDSKLRNGMRDGYLYHAAEMLKAWRT